MAIFKRAKMALLTKMEAAYATNPTPTGAANAIEAYDVEFERLSTLIPRNYARPTLGATGDTEALVHARLDFWIPMTGAGAAGDAPLYGPQHRACALAETIDAETDVEYALVSASEESVAHAWHMDGHQAVLLGVRGTMSAELTQGQIPRWRYQHRGLFPAEPGAVALPSLTMTGWQAPKTHSKVNTPTFTLGGTALKLQSFTANLNIDTSHRDFTNHQAVEVTGRANGVRGEMVVLAEALGTWNPFAIAKAETLAALNLVHGVGAGNIVQFDAPKVQILQPKYDTVDGSLAIRCGLLFAEDEGNDEILITVK